MEYWVINTDTWKTLLVTHDLQLAEELLENDEEANQIIFREDAYCPFFVHKTKAS